MIGHDHSDKMCGFVVYCTTLNLWLTCKYTVWNFGMENSAKLTAPFSMAKQKKRKETQHNGLTEVAWIPLEKINTL